MRTLRDSLRRHRALMLRILFFLCLSVSCTVVLRYAIYRSPRATYKSNSHRFDQQENAALTQSSSLECDIAESVGRYAVIFDAGTTGSRVHVYKYTKNSTIGSIDLHSEVVYRSTPGLASFQDPHEAAASLKPLLDFALKEVPESHRNPCTPVWLKATTGLRILGMEKSVSILNEVHKIFRTYPFLVPDDAVELMDGKDEGVFAWLTVNFLLGNFDTPADSKGKAESAKPSTVGVVDMGSGSTQVVFAPDEPVSTLLYAPDVNTHVVHYFGREVSLYQHSYLGFGLVEARNAVKKRLAGQGNRTKGEVFQVPCFPPGYLEEIKLEASRTSQVRNPYGEKPSETIPIQGASHLYGFDQCMPVVYDVLNKTHPCPSSSCSFNGVHQPTLEHAFKGDWYLMSNFYSIVKEYMKNIERDHLTLNDYKIIAQDACKSGISGDQDPYLCLDSTFLYVLLAHGYELSDSQVLYPKNNINGFELGWTLGAMIEEVA
ncbi:guanosine-diphosphatase [Perkinsela sp. CCAP 1560/4]|nr:guanosine-diphosphatase [Perkinsela sp. CCAP 1560/4]|eukprot:KNH03661.1 guanosine-diphosphatase [Perkinsela sp. CCAP 1560/4]